jgi:large subunit ribosomal protein L25
MKLNSEMRTLVGTKPAKLLRRENKIPAILYGSQTDPIPITVDYKEFLHAYKEERKHQSFIFLKLNNKEYRVLMKDVQVDPVTRRFIHVDFQEIYTGQKIETEAVVEVFGEAPGVKAGGILDLRKHELKIRCLPKDLPEAIRIDVSKLELGDNIRVSDITQNFPDTEFLEDPSETIASVVLPTREKVEKPEEAVSEAEEEEVVSEAEEPKEKQEKSES